MENEIKLFVITKYLHVLLGDWDSIKSTLEKLFDMPYGYWENWIKRYKTLSGSQETVIMMLKHSGYTYRQIQKIVKVSPSTIQRTLEKYDLKFAPLEGSENLDDHLKRIEERMEAGGIDLW